MIECGLVPAISVEIDFETLRLKRGRRKRAPGIENRETIKKTKHCLNQLYSTPFLMYYTLVKINLLSSVLDHVDDE